MASKNNDISALGVISDAIAQVRESKRRERYQAHEGTCPYCGSLDGEMCVSRSGHERRIDHAARSKTSASIPEGDF